MFEFLKPNPATALLEEDHARVKVLCDRFEGAKGRGNTGLPPVAP